MQQMMQYIQPTSVRKGSVGSIDPLGSRVLTDGLTEYEQTKHPYLEGNLKYCGNKGDDNPM